MLEKGGYDVVDAAAARPGLCSGAIAAHLFPEYSPYGIHA
jgi:hypothetical protein